MVRRNIRRKNQEKKLKRAQLVVVVSVLILSSFARQNPGASAKSAQAAPQGAPAQGVPSHIFGFRDFSIGKPEPVLFQ